jgi:diaminohydroxyphosphoribosylaminopyrimidine deaminase / 5-amino-6-(5-phosphoribosylamino)uracil reductase
MADADHAAFMARALDLARRGWGLVQPNPLVGAVVVRDGLIAGEGWHGEYGGPHAEIHALRAAGSAARGATLYVTLEPCAHTDKTPPCTDAVIAAGVARVVYAVADPDPAAAGGAAALRSAGIDVIAGVGEAAARSLNAAFFQRFRGDRPFVALKLASSVDGRIAARPGVRTAITGPEAATEVHRMRAGYEGVLIGAGTASVDDPLLTVRLAATRRQPTRIVLDSRAALSLSSKLVASSRETPLWVVCLPDAPSVRVRALEAAGARVLHAGPAPGGVDAREALAVLRTAGITSILAEGGSKVAAALLCAGAVDRLHLFLAPRFLGQQAVTGLALPCEVPGSWTWGAADRLGEDVLLTLDRKGEA